MQGQTQLVTRRGGLLKLFGERLTKCDADQMGRPRLEQLAAGPGQSLEPLLESMEALTGQIAVNNAHSSVWRASSIRKRHCGSKCTEWAR